MKTERKSCNSGCGQVVALRLGVGRRSNQPMKRRIRYQSICFAVLILCMAIVLGSGCSQRKDEEKPTLDVWVRNAYYPDEDIGRINKIIIDPTNPSTVYAAAREALVIKITYTRTLVHNEFLSFPSKYQVAVRPELAMISGPPGLQYIEDLAVDPKNPHTLYAAFAGIFKSEDRGKNWVQVYNMPTVLSIVVDPSNPQIIYAGHQMEGIIQSTDVGKTWHNVLRTHFVTSLLVQPGGDVFAASGSGLYKTSDRGKNWEKLSDTFLLSLISHPSDSSVIYGTSSGNSAGTEQVLRSDDAGRTWSIMLKVTAKEPTKVILAPKVPLAVAPNTPSTIYVGTISSGIMKSTDGGKTWSDFNNGLPNAAIISLAVDPKDSRIVFAGTESGEVFRIVQSK